MTILDLNDPKLSLRSMLSVRSAEGVEPLLDLIAELARLVESLDGDLGFVAADGQLERYADSSYTYLEADVPLLDDAEIDMNVHNGRVYFRVAR